MKLEDGADLMVTFRPYSVCKTYKLQVTSLFGSKKETSLPNIYDRNGNFTKKKNQRIMVLKFQVSIKTLLKLLVFNLND